MGSIWEQSLDASGFPRLEKNIKTDVLIIGGGLAGILCAYMLSQAGVDYVLAEAKTICGGVTGGTTAKLTVQHGLIYNKLISEFGEKKAGLYFQANQAALEEYRRLCQGIDCDFEEKSSFVYSLNDRRKMEKEAAALEELGCRVKFWDKLPLPFNVAGAVEMKNQAQFNPLKFVSAVSRGLNIYENTQIKELIGTTAITENGQISARRIVIATHFPILNKHGCYFLKMYQHRSYVLALENGAEVDGMYVDEDKKGLSFRNYGQLLLLGGGGHRTGKKGGGWRELRDFAKLHYPNSTEVAHWAAQDCMTLDGVPYIGAYSAGTKNLYVATGFNKWGMTSSMAAAMLLRDLLLDRENQYEKLFSPSRTILRPQLAANSAEAVVNLLTPSKRRCPHLGCALKWNCQEHTWDCPCHGSRFTKDGGLIDNPSTGDLNI